MRRPGRPSAAFPMIDSGWRPLLQPPPELSASQRELFATITSTCKADHFREADAPLIALRPNAHQFAIFCRRIRPGG